MAKILYSLLSFVLLLGCIPSKRTEFKHLETKTFSKLGISMTLPPDPPFLMVNPHSMLVMFHEYDPGGCAELQYVISIHITEVVFDEYWRKEPPGSSNRKLKYPVLNTRREYAWCFLEKDILSEKRESILRIRARVRVTDHLESDLEDAQKMVESIRLVE